MTPEFEDKLPGKFGSKEERKSGTLFSDKFENDAITQGDDLGYTISEGAERFGSETTTTLDMALSILMMGQRNSFLS